MEEYIFSSDINIPFPSAREAEIAYRTLQVDAEPRRSTVKKILSQHNNVLTVSIKAKEARQLRVSVNSFLEFVILVTRTMEKFGPPKV